MNHSLSSITDSIPRMINDSVRTFLEFFARTALAQTGNNENRSDFVVSKEVSEFLISQRPYFVHLMCLLGKEDYFQKQILDEVTRKTLVNLVMNSEYNLPKLNRAYGEENRKPIDLREACTAGSKIARILIVEKVLIAQKVKDQQRIARIRAQQEVETAAREKEELNKQIEELEKKKQELAQKLVSTPKAD